MTRVYADGLKEEEKNRLRSVVVVPEQLLGVVQLLLGEGGKASK
jgi:hypothetical protein